MLSVGHVGPGDWEARGCVLGIRACIALPLHVHTHVHAHGVCF